MLSGTSAGVFNISHFFQVFWSETGSAMEYGEDFARIVCTLQEINLSHLGKRKIILKYAYQGDMLIPWRVIVNYFALGVSILLNEFQTRSPLLLAF